MVDGEHLPGAGESGLHLVGDQHDVVAAAPVGQRGEEAGRRDDEPALALDRLDHQRGEVLDPHLLLDDVECLPGRLGAVATAVAERVGHRRAVDLRGERAESALVGHVLRGQGHRQVGAAVVGVVERHHRLLPGERPGDLDRVLDRFGTGVEQHRPLLVAAGRHLVEPLGDAHVALVRRDHEAGVGERLHLGGHGLRDPRSTVADGGDRDPRAEVDQGVTVHVDDDAATGGHGVDRQGGADRLRDCGVLARLQGPRPRAGDLRDEAALLGQGRSAGGQRGVGHRVLQGSAGCRRRPRYEPTGREGTGKNAQSVGQSPVQNCHHGDARRPACRRRPRPGADPRPGAGAGGALGRHQ